jgi:hypothetical protein
MNAVGAPGFLRDTEFRSKTFGTHVRVKCDRLFTVVSVNGLDVYFSRLSGKIDGLGFSPTSASTPALTSQSTCSAALTAQLDSALTRSPMQLQPRG